MKLMKLIFMKTYVIKKKTIIISSKCWEKSYNLGGGLTIRKALVMKSFSHSVQGKIVEH